MNETKLQTPKKVILFSNGNTACFDDKGEQIPELQQKGTIQCWLEWMETKGIDPLKIEMINTVINGKDCLLNPFKTEFGWNYEIID
mgnify:FL=1